MAEDSTSIKPDATVQSKLRDIAQLVVRAGAEGGEEKLIRAIVALDPAGKNRPELVRQLIWQHAHSSDVAEGMTLFTVIHVKGISSGAMVDAIAPLLGNTRDPKLEQACIEVANIVEHYDFDRGPDFRHYRSHIEAKLLGKLPLELGLVEHMFRRSPGQAFQTFATITYDEPMSLRAFFWARHVVDDVLWKEDKGFDKAAADARPAAIEQLDLLAKRKEWWARLYVAEIIREHKELRTPELIARLEKDEHLLVRKLIAERDQKRPPPLNRPSAK